MKKQYEEDRILYIDEEQGDKVMGYVTFPKNEKGNFELDHTVVSQEYQGQGLAGKLVQDVVDLAKEKKVKIKPTCSYAVKWFEKNEEFSDLKE